MSKREMTPRRPVRQNAPGISTEANSGTLPSTLHGDLRESREPLYALSMPTWGPFRDPLMMEEVIKCPINRFQWKIVNKKLTSVDNAELNPNCHCFQGNPLYHVKRCVNGISMTWKICFVFKRSLLGMVPTKRRRPIFWELRLICSIRRSFTTGTERRVKKVAYSHCRYIHVLTESRALCEHDSYHIRATEKLMGVEQPSWLRYENLKWRLNSSVSSSKHHASVLSKFTVNRSRS